MKKLTFFIAALYSLLYCNKSIAQDSIGLLYNNGNGLKNVTEKNSRISSSNNSPSFLISTWMDLYSSFGQDSGIDSLIYTYNAAGYVTENTDLKNENGNRTLSAKESYKYDINYNITEYLYQECNYLNILRNNYREVSEFDSRSNQLNVIRQNWDTLQNKWQNSRKAEYSYSAKNEKLLAATYFSDSTEAWIKLTKEEWEYDLNGNIKTYSTFYKIYNANEWRAFKKNEFSYSEDSEKLSDYTSYWDTIQSKWNLSSRILNTLSQGLKISTNEINIYGNWVNYSKVESRVNNNGIETMNTNYHWFDTIWVPQFRTSNTFSNGVFLLQSVSLRWNTFSNQWDTISNKVNYVTGNLIDSTYIYQKDQWGVSYLYSRSYLTYYAPYKPITSIYYSYDLGTHSWYLAYNQTVYYNDDGVRSEFLSERYYDSAPFNLNYKSHSKYYYSKYNSFIAGVAPDDDLGIIVFPNPSFNTNIKLAFDSDNPGKMDVKIFDSKGSLVLNELFDFFAGSNFYELNTQNLRKGAYTLEIINLLTGKHGSRRVIK